MRATGKRHRNLPLIIMRCRASSLMKVMILLGTGALSACNPFDFMACRDEMSSSQQVLIDMNDQKLDDVEKSLSAVQRAIKACDGVASDSDTAKLRDAEAQLDKQRAGLRARAVPKERPKLSEEELAKLEKTGDRDCPQGQRYEHPQNKKMIRCTGSQVIDMAWAEAEQQFAQRRGFAQLSEGAKLKFELGAEVVEFEFETPKAKSRAKCVSITGQPGIAWQELVARATGVEPRVMKLGKPIPSKNGPLPLIVEGTAEQFVVKLGACGATPGQKPYIEAPDDKKP